MAKNSSLPPSLTADGIAGAELSRTERFQVIRGNEKELTRKLISKFGSTYLDLVRQYGAVEYTVDDEGEITAVLPPEEYLAESDELAIDRFLAGDHESRSYSITAGALARLAYAEAYFYAVQVTQLRNEPAFLREQVEDAARHRPELLPDINGNAPTAEELLSNPRFIGQLTRFTIYNMLSHLGAWDTIAKYLEDISSLDKTKGRFGALSKRKKLLGCVKFMIEQEISLVEKRIRHGIVVFTRAGRFWTRHSNHADYTGIRMALNPAKNDEFLAIVASRTLEGALVRFAAYEQIGMILQWTEPQSRGDLLSFLGQSSEAQRDDLGGHLSHQLTQLKRLIDFSDMINHPEDPTVPSQGRYHDLALALQESQRIIAKEVNLEQYMSDLPSLENDRTFIQLWHVIDSAFLEKCGKLPEQFIGFTPMAPKWHGTPQPQPQVSSPSLPSDLTFLDTSSDVDRDRPMASVSEGRPFLSAPVRSADDASLSAEQVMQTFSGLDITSPVESSKSHSASPKSSEPPCLITGSVVSSSSQDTVPPVQNPPNLKSSPETQPPFVKPKPYWTRVATALEPLDISSGILSAGTKKSKVKTRPLKPSVPKDEGPNEQEPEVTLPKLPMFYVHKKIYNVFEHVFSGGEMQGQITWADFLRAMTHLGFEMSIKLSDGGRSMVTFIPPNSHKNVPFVCHKPNSSKAALQRMWQREYASSLAGLYGWSMDWFALKSDAPMV